MDRLTSLFTTSKASSQSSILDSWELINKETPRGHTSTTDPAPKESSGGWNILSAFSSAPAPPEEEEDWLSKNVPWLPRCSGLQLSQTQRFTLAAISLLFGVVMLFMSLSLLWMLQIERMLTAYTLANIGLLLSATFFVGLRTQLASMFSSQRAMISCVYLCSTILVIYVCLSMPYIYFLLPAFLLQVTSLVAYVISYIPFGNRSLGLMSSLGFSVMKRSAQSVLPM